MWVRGLDYSAAREEATLAVASPSKIVVLLQPSLCLSRPLHRLVPELVRQTDVEGPNEWRADLSLLVGSHGPVRLHEDSRCIAIVRHASIIEMPSRGVGPLLLTRVRGDLGRAKLLHEQVRLAALAMATSAEGCVLLWIGALAWLSPATVVALALP